MDGVSASPVDVTRAADGSKPYVGLRPYGEADRDFFFGREQDEAVIYANAVATRLTVLYGASGVGKSSLLRAGVVPRVRLHSEAAAVYYNRWQTSDFEEALNRQCAAAMAAVCPDLAVTIPAPTTFDECLRLLTAAADRPIFVLLDQFEEYLLYHSGEQHAFDLAVARAVNRRDVDVRLLIGIRDDALHRFDERFRRRIVNPLGNTLRLRHLTDAQATRAITEPLRVFREKSPATSAPTEIAEETVRGILRQVRPAARPDVVEREGASPPDVPIETAYLQLVLGKLWDAESRHGGRELRLATLDNELGGAGRIVYQHLLEVIAALSPRGRAICEHVFPHLVTPSLSKIAHETRDIVAFVAEKGRFNESDVHDVLTELSAPSERRILRRTFPPERFEIFHDVLARPILEWIETRRRVAAASRWRRIAAALIAAVAILGGLTAASVYYARRAGEASAQFNLARNEADRARSYALREADLRKQALEALKAGKQELADKLEQQAQEAQKSAASRQVTTPTELAELKSLRDDVGHLKQQVAQLTATNQKLTTERDQAFGEAQRLQKELTDTERQLAVSRDRDAIARPERDDRQATDQTRATQQGAVNSKRENSSGGADAWKFWRSYGIYIGKGPNEFRVNKYNEVPPMGARLLVNVTQPNKGTRVPGDTKGIAGIVIPAGKGDIAGAERVMAEVVKDYMKATSPEQDSEALTQSAKQKLKQEGVNIVDVNFITMYDSTGGPIAAASVPLTFQTGGRRFRIVLNQLDTPVGQALVYEAK